MTWSDLLSVAAALAYVAGGVCMKATDGMQRPAWLLGVYVAFGLGCTLQTFAMRGQDLGANYLVVLGLEAAAAFGAGLLLFGEAATPARVGGVLLIAAGIALLRA